MKIENRLRMIMAEKRIDSISELHRITGLSRTVLDKLYHEKNMDGLTLGVLYRLCEGLGGIELADLVEFEYGKTAGAGHT